MAFPLLAAVGIGASIAGKIVGAKEAKRVSDILHYLPTYQKVDVGAEQTAAIAGNLLNVPKAAELAGQTNAANVTNAQAMYRAMIPDYDRLVAQASGLISNQMAGKLFPDQVSRNLARSAGKALSGGFAGSGFWKNLAARDLGLETYQVTQQGLANTMNWLNTQRAAMPKQLSVESMFLTPSERVNWGIQQAQLEYQSALTAAFGRTAPGLTGYWANALQEMGGQLTGAGMMGGLGGGGAGGTPPTSNPGWLSKGGVFGSGG